MRPSLKQRLIGLGLLLLLLLVLVPWALQVPDKLQLQLNADMPPVPEVVWQPLVSPISEESLQQVADDIRREREESIADELSDKEELRAFALRLTQFDQRKLALVERQRLNDAGYRAYVRQQADGFALYVGPELQLPRLQLVQQQLQADKRFHFTEVKRVTYHP